MMLGNIFPEWYLAQTILEEMAAARSRIMHFHAEMEPVLTLIRLPAGLISA